jgi:hypothetical protein
VPARVQSERTNTRRPIQRAHQSSLAFTIAIPPLVAWWCGRLIGS